MKKFALSLAALSFCLAGAPPSASAQPAPQYGDGASLAIMAVGLPLGLVALPVLIPITYLRMKLDRKEIRRGKTERGKRERKAGITRPDKPVPKARRARPAGAPAAPAP